MMENRLKVDWFDMLAVRILTTKLDNDTISLINNYIDSNELKDYSHNLVGQMKQNEKSAQLKLPLSDKDPKFISEILTEISKHYAKMCHAEIKKSVVESMWSVHSYSGDYNPAHDHHLGSSGEIGHSGLSCILYLKVPECIENDPNDPFTLNNASGHCDGHTQFLLGSSGARDIFKPPTNIYIKPEEGLILMFPIWLQHLVEPFYGEGERRSLSANIAVYV